MRLDGHRLPIGERRAFDDFREFKCLYVDCVREDPHGGPGAIHHIARIQGTGDREIREVPTAARVLCRLCGGPIEARRDGPDLVLWCQVHGRLGEIPPLPPGVVVKYAPAAAAWAAFSLRSLEPVS